MFTTHTEPHYSANPEGLAIYRDLLSELAALDEAWLARPVDIALWWSSRPSVPIGAQTRGRRDISHFTEDKEVARV